MNVPLAALLPLDVDVVLDVGRVEPDPATYPNHLQLAAVGEAIDGARGDVE
jgi:hypothetical protein